MTLRKILLVLAFSLLIISASLGCELKFSITGENKTTYKPGEEVIVEIEVVYTHRKCEIELSDTKFTYSGIKILGATPWKEKNPATFSRQIKIQMLDDQKDEGILTISRKCSKEGVLGSIRFIKTL